MKTFYVNCPFCEGMMEIDAETGEMIKKWPAKEKSKTGDTMGDALKKLEEDKKKREGLFDRRKSEIEDQKKRAEDVFRKGVDKIKKEGLGEGPPTPFDLD